MKILLLMRHAEAAAEGSGDKGRRLTAAGIANATRIGHFLDGAGFLPDLALVSDAVRTRETVDSLSPALRSQPKIEYDDAIYRADAESLLELVRLGGGEALSVLVVGHNPAIGELAWFLAGGGDKLTDGFPPAGVAVFEVDCGDWTEIAPGNARLLEFMTPAKLPADTP